MLEKKILKFINYKTQSNFGKKENFMPILLILNCKIKKGAFPL
jgi:hypothetical protein